MTRNEAKKQMRIDMEFDIPKEMRDIPSIMIGGLTPNQVMAEVDEGSPVGENFLTEYITYNARGGELDKATRNHIISMMQDDLKGKEDFADQPRIHNPKGGMLTPNQIIEEVKLGTELGNLYADEWMATYGRYINTDALTTKKTFN